MASEGLGHLLGRGSHRQAALNLPLGSAMSISLLHGAATDEEVRRDDARRLRLEELSPARARLPRRGLQLGSPKQSADTHRRCLPAELRELAADPAMAPARVLPGEPKHELLDLAREPWTARPAALVAPFPTHERPVPTQQRPRRDRSHGGRRARQVTSGGREKRAINSPKAPDGQPDGAGHRARDGGPSARCPLRSGPRRLRTSRPSRARKARQAKDKPMTPILPSPREGRPE
jgi:hypothetical protein